MKTRMICQYVISFYYIKKTRKMKAPAKKAGAFLHFNTKEYREFKKKIIFFLN